MNTFDGQSFLAAMHSFLDGSQELILTDDTMVSNILFSICLLPRSMFLILLVLHVSAWSLTRFHCKLAWKFGGNQIISIIKLLLIKKIRNSSHSSPTHSSGHQPDLPFALINLCSDTKAHNTHVDFKEDILAQVVVKFLCPLWQGEVQRLLQPAIKPDSLWWLYGRMKWPHTPVF